jgi:hypothetical protein
MPLRRLDVPPPPGKVSVVPERTLDTPGVGPGSASTATTTATATATSRGDGDGGDGSRIVRPRGWAKLVTDILSPAHFVIALPPIIGWHATYPGAAGLGWGLFCAVLAGGVPYGFVIHAVLRRGLSDIHIRTRQDRYIPILVALGAMGLCIAVLVLGSAPRVLTALLGRHLRTLLRTLGARALAPDRAHLRGAPQAARSHPLAACRGRRPRWRPLAAGHAGAAALSGKARCRMTCRGVRGSSARRHRRARTGRPVGSSG